MCAAEQILVAAELFQVPDPQRALLNASDSASLAAGGCNDDDGDCCVTRYLTLDADELFDGMLHAFDIEASEAVATARALGLLGAGGMAACGSLPICGEVQGAVSGLYHVAKGDWDEAGLDAASLALPFVSVSGFRALDSAGTAFRRVCSFDGDTEVLMADGSTKPISEVEVGDKVLATDPEVGSTGARMVIRSLPHLDQLLTLRTSVGELTTTEEHRFWSVSKWEWQAAGQLGTGEGLLTADGSEVRARGIDWSTVHTAMA